jgi:hypothetical protein
MVSSEWFNFYSPLTIHIFTTHQLIKMLKRTGASLLALLYMVTVIGFALNFHYCFGYVSSVKINAPVKSCNFGATTKMKCCKDKHFEVKVKDAHQAVSQSFLAKVFAFESSALAFADFSFSAQQAFLVNDFERGPPKPPSNEHVTFLKNCTFRI